MPQKHSTIRDGKRLIWYTEGLWERAKDLTPFEIDPRQIPELDMDCWFDGMKPPTIRAVIAHCRRIIEADFRYPVILNDDGSLMDGGHRIARAILEDKPTITAVQFATMPPPDQVVALDTV